MDTLMRILKLVALGVLLVAGMAPDAHAQAPAAGESRFFFNINLGGQWKEQTFTDTSTFTIYTESGAVAAAHAIGGGTLFDVGVGARVWENLAVGIAYSAVTNRNDAAISVRVPHPVVFGQARTASTTAPDLKHSEDAVHLQFMWMIPLTNKFELAVMAGPSFFTVKQTLATVLAPQDISDPPPYNNVTITNVTLTDVKDSPVGLNIGVDGTYFIRTINGVGIGVGGFIRYAGASLDLPVTSGATRDTDLDAGGPQGALGLRLRF
jgi:hypothetical protein